MLMVFILELLKVWLDACVGIAWPFVAILVIHTFAKPIKELIVRLRAADLSKDGARFEFDAFVRVAENKASPEERRQVQSSSVGERGQNASGSYTVYSNRTIVARMKVELKANSSSRQLTLPISMVNDVTSVQVVGDAKVRVTALSLGAVGIAFDPADKDRSIELIISGL